MQTNVYRALIELLPQSPLLSGVVTVDHGDGSVTVEFPGGGTQRVRGVADVADRVFVRGGVVETPAPVLTNITIEI